MNREKDKKREKRKTTYKNKPVSGKIINILILW